MKNKVTSATQLLRKSTIIGYVQHFFFLYIAAFPGPQVAMLTSNSLFCNNSVFLLSSALLPSDPCFSARQSCKKYSYKLTILCEAALWGRGTGAQTPRRASKVSCAAASSPVR